MSSSIYITLKNGFLMLYSKLITILVAYILLINAFKYDFF